MTELGRVPESGRVEAFFHCWTRKEAYIKAHGRGLSMSLSSFDVTLTPESEAALLATHEDPEEASRWTMRRLEPGSGFVGALAVRAAAEWQLRLWEWK